MRHDYFRMDKISAFFDFTILSIRGEVFTVEFFIIHLIIPLVLLLVLSRLFRHIILLIAGNDNGKASRDSHISHTKGKGIRTRYDIALKVIHTITLIIVIVIVVRLLLLLLSLRNIVEIFTTPFFTNGNITISFLNIVQIIILLYIANSLSKIGMQVSQRYVIQHVTIKNKNSLGILIRYGVFTIVIFVGLPFIGIDIRSLNLVFGALGFGIGFGLQDVVGNFISGISMNTSRVINEGDRVLVMDIEGTVEHINMLHTVIRNLSGDELIIPNKYLTNNPVQNYTHSDRIFYINCKVQVSYQSDLYMVEKVMKEAAETMPYRETGKDMFFRVQKFADSGIKVAIYVCIRDVKDRYQVSSDLHIKVWELFKKYAIEIPYPQLDMLLKNKNNVFVQETSQEMTTDE